MKSKRNAFMAIAFAGVIAAGAAYYLYPNMTSKKVLFIDSYHQGYPWSDGITSGIQSVFAGTDVELMIHRMDTKRNGSEDFKKKAALKAKAFVSRTGWKGVPDGTVFAVDPDFRLRFMTLDT